MSQNSKLTSSTRNGKVTIHHVQRGDSLIRLAQRYLGDGRRFREIYEANKNQLESPDTPLRIGMTLRIPNAQNKPTVSRGRIASTKHSPSHSARTASKASRPHQAPVQNVSRIRETTPVPSARHEGASIKEEDSTATNGKSKPSPKDRFVPVKKAPFLMRSFQSSTSDKELHDLISKRSLKFAEWPRSPSSSNTTQYEFFPKGESPLSTRQVEETKLR